MRGLLSKCLSILCLISAAAAMAFAQAGAQDVTTPEGLVISLRAPAREVHVDDRFEIEVLLSLPQGAGEAALPLLVTPSAEGSAIEVVRGRLLRADAEDPDARPLVLRVPLVARRPGTAVVRVRVRTFACESGRCLPVLGESSVAIPVRPRS